MLETHRLIEHNKLARAYSHYDEIFGSFEGKTFAEHLRESLFAEIKHKFNTELFQQPLLCDELKIDNEALATVIGHEPLHADLAATCGIAVGQGEMFPFRHLYLYDFSKMSQDVMGAVYERFLAHKLFARGGRIEIEDTDELREEGRHILYAAVYSGLHCGPHARRKDQTRSCRGADVAWLQKLPRRVREDSGTEGNQGAGPRDGFRFVSVAGIRQIGGGVWGIQHACRKAKTERGNGSGMLFDAEAGIAEEIDHLGIRVARENIFGVDLDAQAIEVAKLNLWMRLMIVERDFIRAELQKRGKAARPMSFLPDLRNNLRRGNSLIADQAVAGDSAFDWQNEFPEIMKRGGFDVVIGNPPYERIQTMMGNAPQAVEFLKTNYRSGASGNFDIYVCFIERGLELLNADGFFGYICPNKFFQSEYGQETRQLLSEGRNVSHLVNFFGHLQSLFTGDHLYLFFYSCAGKHKRLWLFTKLKIWLCGGKKGKQRRCKCRLNC